MFFAFLLVLSVVATAAHGDDSAEVRVLKEQVDNLQRTVEQLQRTIQTMQKSPAVAEDQLQRRVEEAVRKQQTEMLRSRLESPLDQALKETEVEEGRRGPAYREAPTRHAGLGAPRLIDISFVPTLFMGSSTERDETLQTLQGGGHDPHKRGFTLAEGELGLAGSVDPYFRGQAYITTFIDALSGETSVELEEAFLTTQSLPYGLQLEVGHFLTEFGQINPRHPHQWDWNDQPLINTRLFGGDGMRAPGLRVGWLLPTPERLFSELHVGMQNANGEQMTSFLGGRHEHGGEAEHAHEEEAELEGAQIGNRPAIGRDTEALKDFVYLARWNSSWEAHNDLGIVLGVSGLYGPNDTGPRGDTWIYGADMKWRWRPANNFRGWPFLTWQTEIMQREFKADRFIQANEEDGDVFILPGRTLYDWGLYSQLLYGFRYGWATGIRYEYAGGSGQSIDGRKNDPFRSDRHRFSPLLAFHPSEFTRIRLQYNLDHANHLANGKNAHSVWLSFQWLYGAHPPHEY
jgi:hypothetical protein